MGQVECGATKPVIISARPMPPAVPRATQASLPAIPVAGSGLAPFRHFIFARCGARVPRGQHKGFPRSGRMQGSIGPERCGSGPPNGPFEWPNSWFGRAQSLNSDTPAGCGSKRGRSGPIWWRGARACPRGPANAQGGLGRVWWVHWGPLSRSGPTGSAHTGRGPRNIAPKVPPEGVLACSPAAGGGQQAR